MNSSKVSIYNLKSKDWKQIKIDEVENHNYYRFFAATIYKDKLFLVGSIYPAIMIIDFKTYKTKYISQMYDKYMDEQSKNLDCFFRTDIACVESKLYIASCQKNEVVIFDMDNFNFETVVIGNDDNKYSGIAWDGESFWLSPRHNSSIVKWNPNGNTLREFKLDMLSGKKYSFTGVIYSGQNIIFPGMQCGKSMIVNEKKDADPEIRELDNNYYLFYMNDGEYNYAMTADGKFMVFKINTPGIIVNEYTASVDNAELVEFSLFHGNIVKESDFFKLNDFLDGVLVK